ncbi:hypothetical protein ANRL2_00632 [Anaerolineae bacterium]|nr:hypothetical protein ANRL2_00632 [Anaerolineae bacterium]
MKLPFQLRMPRLPSGATESLSKNLLTILAAIVIIGIVIGYAFFFISFVNPALQTRNRVAAQVADAQKAARDRGILPESPDSMQARLNDTRATLVAVSNAFLTDAQVSAAIKVLYQYADESQVTISDLKTEVRSGVTLSAPTPAPTFTPTPVASPTLISTRPPVTGTPTVLVSPTASRAPVSPTVPPTSQPTQKTIGSDLYRATTVRLQVKGAANQLVEFVSRIKETTLKGFIINSINIEGDERSALLTMEIAMLSSASASGTATPTRKPQPPAPVVTSIPPPPPPPPPITLTPTPTATMPAIPTATPTATLTPPRGIIYIVRAGDTLYSIARRYGTTVEAIMAANRLSNYNISIGQQLLIPQ